MDKGTAKIAIVLGIVALFVLFAAYLWFVYIPSQEQATSLKTQEVAATQDWKTYRNEEYGIQFKYPPSVTIHSPSLETDRSKAWGEFTVSIGKNNFINALTLQEAQELDNTRCRDGGFCLETWTSAGQWSKHKNILESTTSGIVQKKDCPSSLVECKVETIGENKFLLIYGWAGGPYSTTQKKYITYHKGVRYEFYSVTPEVKTINYNVAYPVIHETDTFESSDSYGQLVRNILSTLQFSDMDLNDVSAWKTYHNEEYGFELKYPVDWEEKTGVDSGIGIKVESLTTGSIFSISRNRNEQNLTLDEWFKETTNMGGRPTIKAAAEQIFINGVKAYRINSDLLPPNNYFEIIAIADKQNNIYTISANYNVVEDGKVLDQMLSTFKFIN